MDIEQVHVARMWMLSVGLLNVVLGAAMAVMVVSVLGFEQHRVDPILYLLEPGELARRTRVAPSPDRLAKRQIQQYTLRQR